MPGQSGGTKSSGGGKAYPSDGRKSGGVKGGAKIGKGMPSGGY